MSSNFYVDAVDVHGKTPLHYAAYGHRVPVVEVLLNRPLFDF